MDTAPVATSDGKTSSPPPPIAAPDEWTVISYPYSLPGQTPKKIFVPTGFDYTACLIHTARPWEFRLAIEFYSRVSRGGSMIEVGANIGSDTILAADYFKTCYVFEPARKHFAQLQKTIKLNQFTNVQLFPDAVSNRSGITRLHSREGANSSDASLKASDPAMNHTEEVQVVTLDEAIPESVTDITLLHIDTEGHDIKVLQGARELLSRQKKKPFIKMEFQPRTLVLHGSHIAELIAFMDEFGYKTVFSASNFMVPLTRVMLMEMFYHWASTNGWIDIYLIPQEPAAGR